MNYSLLSYTKHGISRAGILVRDRVYDAAEAMDEERYTSVLGILADWDAAASRLDILADNVGDASMPVDGWPIDQVSLQAPILYPGQIFAAGANYMEHVIEMFKLLNVPIGPSMKDAGEKPWHYIKSSRSSVVGPGSAVSLPRRSAKAMFEIELAVIIGRRAKDVSVENALNYVAGYTIANDLTLRDQTRRPKNPENTPFRYDMLGGKCFDGSCPLGPWITPASVIRDPQNLAMRLWVNDELRQDSNTSQMVFTAAEQLAMLSSRLTLQPGDVILTGAPALLEQGEPKFLEPGDRIRMWIEMIGEMTHTVV